MIEVFIPTWNNETTISKCLRAITVAIPDAKIILIDRFSKDDTLKIAKDFDCEIHQADENIGEARSLMCRMAEGEYFVMVDSDTYLTPEWFKRIQEYKQQIEKVDPKLGILQGENIPIYEPYRGWMLWDRSKRVYPFKNSRRLLTCNLLVKTSVVEDFRTDAPIYEDYLLGEHIRKKGYNFYVVPALAQHDSGQTSVIKKHARWCGAGMRKYARIPFWKVVGAMFYNPLFKYPLKFKRFGFFLHWNWVVGWWKYKDYLELKR